MSFRALPESTSYRDPATGEFFQRQGTVSGSGRYEPIRTMEIRYDRDQPSRAVTLPYIPGQDKSEVVPMRNNAVNKSQKWKEFSAASQDYSQSGTDIPGFSTGSGGAFAAGSDFPGRGFGYQYQSPAIAQGIPVGQDENLPMSQEAFRDAIYTLQEKKRGALTKPIDLAPGLLNRMRTMRSQYGI
jgi:hypothetical protein